MFDDVLSMFMQSSVHLRSLQPASVASANPYAGRVAGTIEQTEFEQSGRPPRTRARRSGTTAGSANENFVNLYQPTLRVKEDSQLLHKSVRGKRIDPSIFEEQVERMRQEEEESRIRENARRAAIERAAAEKKRRDEEARERRRQEKPKQKPKPKKRLIISGTNRDSEGE